MSSGVKNPQPIIFFGTGPVAARSLELLLEHQIIEAVITKPKPEGHRGSFPVFEVANEYKLRVIEVASKTELSEKLASSDITAKVGVLIDFGIIVSQDVIDYFPFGIVNSHFSLLPQWRGADPITFSILSGQKETGVSLMLLVEAMDEGPLLAQSILELPSDITAPVLTGQLIQLSDKMLEQILPLYSEGEVQPAPQETVSIAPSKTATYSRKLTKQDGKVNWNKPAIEIEREVRAYQQWPKSYTKLANKAVEIITAKLSSYSGKPGAVVINNKEIHICCGQDSLQILELKPAGKKSMSAEAFLAGHSHLLNK